MAKREDIILKYLFQNMCKNCCLGQLSLKVACFLIISVSDLFPSAVHIYGSFLFFFIEIVFRSVVALFFHLPIGKILAEISYIGQSVC